MRDTGKKQPPQTGDEAAAPEMNNPDFQYVLKALLAGYQPILEKQLSLAKSPEELEKEARKHPPSCAEEFAEAEALFGKFLTEEVAMRLIPEQGRARLGAAENWRWCLLHIRCCIIFGWLVCRGPRTFRAWAYYVHQYWLCVRQALGNPVANPPTEEQRNDFRVLIEALAKAYKPYLTDQLASVEFPAGIPDEVLAGKIDCFEGQADTCAIFERLLTTEAAQALLGRESFAARQQDANFWFCRCWCLCSICFGCCLARARSLFDVIWCLVYFIRCLADCFRPLMCQILSPAANACTEATFVSTCSPPVLGIAIAGGAAGFAFHHYTLSYSWGGGPADNDAVVYPNCTRPPANPSSNVPVLGGTLGYLDVTLLPAGITQFTVFLDVFDSVGGRVECTQTFEIKTASIEITAAAKVNALVAPDPFNTVASIKLIKDTNDTSVTVPERSIGGVFSVDGSAYTVGCDRIMTQFALANFPVAPYIPVPILSSAAGGTPLMGPVAYADTPSHPWQSGCFPSITTNVVENGDLVAVWSTDNCSFLGIPYTVPKVKGSSWNSIPLNGRFVILLEVRDHLLPAGPFPGDLAGVDQVAVWIDNQEPTADILSIGGVSGCGDLHLKDYVGTHADVLGVAWDPPIDSAAPQQKPNDNFGSYALTFQKNGDPLASGVIVTSNNRVPNIWPGPLGGAFGTLANWDIVSALDGGTGVLPPHSPKIPRGQRCAYVVTLTVSDTTHVGDGGSNHGATALYAIEVINDIP